MLKKCQKILYIQSHFILTTRIICSSTYQILTDCLRVIDVSMEVSLSRVRLFATLWKVAYQAPPFRGFSRQEYWSGLPFPSPGDFHNPGINTRVSFIADRCFTVWATREVLQMRHSGFREGRWCAESHRWSVGEPNMNEPNSHTVPTKPSSLGVSTRCEEGS